MDGGIIFFAHPNKHSPHIPHLSAYEIVNSEVKDSLVTVTINYITPEENQPRNVYFYFHTDSLTLHGDSAKIKESFGLVEHKQTRMYNFYKAFFDHANLKTDNEIYKRFDETSQMHIHNTSKMMVHLEIEKYNLIDSDRWLASGYVHIKNNTIFDYEHLELNMRFFRKKQREQK
ncbi:MAG: hypothetical protein LIP01_13650 [Tannerellaceae bacterium]|nr:hypothetical protein [Tannerellaceae bacterium]